MPGSPRPARPSIPVVPQDDDIIIDEDIYEDTDDFVPSATSSYSYQPPAPSLPDRAPSLPDRKAPSLPDRNVPALPDRNTPKHISPALPGLPPRGAPTASLPGLPPRNPSRPTSGSNPQEYEATNIPKKPAAPPPVMAPDEELYDDVLLTDTGAGDEAEEMYDDVLLTDTGAGDKAEEMYDDVIVGENGDAVEEELYDDVVAVTTGTEEPITEEFYEDMAPHTPDPYVTMEKKGEGEEDDEELYVDVDPSPVVVSPSNKKPPQKQLSAPKQNNTKSTTLSRMFQGKKSTASGGKGGLSGSLAYKAPKKTKFDEKWGVVEGNYLFIYKSSSEKRSQDKMPLGDCKLEIGSKEAGAGKFAFRLIKGDKTHHFSFKEASELEEWVGVVKGLVKFAVETGSVAGEDEVYEAKEDHIGDGEGELTFKKGTYIRLVSKESPDMWVGQIGTEDQVFEGKVGKFPADKVQLAEDLYF